MPSKSRPVLLVQGLEKPEPSMWASIWRSACSGNKAAASGSSSNPAPKAAWSSAWRSGWDRAPRHRRRAGGVV